MKQAYRRAMEHIRLSPRAREEILRALERPRPRRRLERPAVIAAVAAVVLTVTAAAAAMQLVFFHSLPREVAETMRPVGRSITRSGITLTVQSGSVADGKLRLYITLKDEEGDRLSEHSADMTYAEVYQLLPSKTGGFHEVPMHTTGSGPEYAGIVSRVETGPLSYDGESGTYGFLLEVRDMEGAPLPFLNYHFHLYVYGIQIDGDRAEASLTPEWPDASQKAETALVRWERPSIRAPIRAYSSAEELFIDFRRGTELLAPWESGLPVTENHEISAIGWVDGRLHIQERFTGLEKKPDIERTRAVTEPFSQLAPTRPDGTQAAAELLYTFYTEDEETCFQEKVYDITSEELADCALAGAYETGTEVLRNVWHVDFSLEEEP